MTQRKPRWRQRHRRWHRLCEMPMSFHIPRTYRCYRGDTKLRVRNYVIISGVSRESRKNRNYVLRLSHRSSSIIVASPCKIVSRESNSYYVITSSLSPICRVIDRKKSAPIIRVYSRSTRRPGHNIAICSARWDIVLHNDRP